MSTNNADKASDHDAHSSHSHGHGHSHSEGHAHGGEKTNVVGSSTSPHLHGKDCGHIAIAHNCDHDGKAHLGFVCDDGSVSCYVAPDNVSLEDLCFDNSERSGDCDCDASASPHLHAKLAVAACTAGECDAECDTEVVLPLLDLESYDAGNPNKAPPCSPSRWAPVGMSKKNKKSSSFIVLSQNAANCGYCSSIPPTSSL